MGHLYSVLNLQFVSSAARFVIHKRKKKILEESYISGLSIHPEAAEMYQDLKKMFWWPSINKDFSSLCIPV